MAVGHFNSFDSGIEANETRMVRDRPSDLMSKMTSRMTRAVNHICRTLIILTKRVSSSILTKRVSINSPILCMDESDNAITQNGQVRLRYSVMICVWKLRESEWIAYSSWHLGWCQKEVVNLFYKRGPGVSVCFSSACGFRPSGYHTI